ncbi:alpha/beta hydrolase [Metabacillus herbersteinensis]|uniref:Alpha/beta hydrolase n=1 Tax=Metabacillus herbersteinensis TaxID=283816 RepID=A0ABV6GIB0_9BACI
MNHEFREEIIQVNGEFPLEGTLTIPTGPEKKHPAVLIIPGTGKSDRDGNLRKFKMNLYKDLADSISKLGFVTLRYDKRGTHKSKGKYVETGFWDLVDDAQQAVHYLKTHPEVDSEKVIILGHSEGCIIAPAVSTRLPVAGLVLIAGVGEPFKTAIPRQFQQVLKEINDMKGSKGKLLRFMIKLQNPEKRNEKFIKKVLSSTTPSIKLFGLIPVNAKWYREHFAYDVMQELSNVKCPTIAITGSKDIQVIPEHAQKLAEAVQGQAEWHIVPNMNHVLRKYPKNHTMLNLMKEYKSIQKQLIDADLISIVSHWLSEHYLYEETIQEENVR